MSATSPATPEAAAPGPAGAGVLWRLRLLGAFELHSDKEAVTRLPSRAVTALLARLALWPQRSHAREELVELLWPGVSAEVGRNRLRQALSTLRSTLEPPGAIGAAVLQADRVTIRMVDGALSCDAVAFERALRAGRSSEARALYGGELLPGFYDEWIADERLRLEALHDALHDAPLPSPVAPAGDDAVPFTDAQAGERLRLPAYMTRLFGSESAQAQLRGLVAEHRLVTVLGPGGCGKTRLAVELARDARERGAAAGGFDVVAFVALMSCRSNEQLLDALLAGLQLRATRSEVLPLIADALAGRRVLLVLDNLEQVVDAARETVARLLALLPQLHLLVTSRRALAIDGEREHVLPPLSLPAADAALPDVAANPAVGLFVDRARAVRADFHLGARNAAVLAELVNELEGMPLAIELAASRVRSFAPQEMLQRLRQARLLANAAATPRLDLLSRPGPRSGVDPRHASMHHVIAWSWAQLDAAQARLLGAVTVFRGGFSAAAARRLWQADGAGSDAQLLIDELLAHSLLTAQAGAGDVLRFDLYEPIREFAAAQPEHAAAQCRWRAHHRAACLAWAQALPTTAPLAEVRLEMPNLLAALAGAAGDGCADEGVELLLALRAVLEDVELSAAGLADAARCVEACADPLRRSRGHTLLGPLLYAGGQYDAAFAHAEAGVRGSAGDPPAHARALVALARVRWRSSRGIGGVGTVEPLLDDAQRVAVGAEPDLLASLQAQRAFIASRLGDHAAAEALHEQALAHWHATGNRHAINSGLYNLAVCAQDAGRHAVAIERLDRVIASVDALDDRRRLSQALNVRGNALSELRRWPQAAEAFRASLREAWQAMASYEVAYALWNLPRALAHLRQPQPALRLAAFAEAFWTSRFGTLGDADHFDLRRVQRLAARQLDAPSCRDAWHDGRLLALADAVALALGPRGASSA